MDDDRSRAGTLRCPACGGLNAADAQWCGQCHKRFVPPPPPPPMATMSPAIAGPAAALSDDPVFDRSFAVSDKSVTWVCANCGTHNDIALHNCMACNTPFVQSLRSPPGGATVSQSIFDRLGRAVRMMAASWRVLMLDPELLVLAMVLLAVVGGSGYWLVNWWLDRLLTGSVYSAMQLRLYLFGSFAFVAYILGVLTNAVILSTAMVRLRGENPSLLTGLRAVGPRLLPLIGWGAIGATISVLLHMAESTIARGRLARGVVRVAEVSWNSVTFFVVPLVLYERLGPFKALGRSSRLFKQRWAETLVGTVGIGFALALVALPFMLVGGSIVTEHPVLGGTIILGSASVVSVFGSTLTGIYNAAVYHYAVTGEALAPFRTSDLKGTFYRPARILG